MYFNQTKVKQHQSVLYSGQTSESLIGKTDFDFYPYEQAENYRREEIEIMRSGEALRDYSRFSLQTAEGLKHYICSKFPLRDEKGRVIGLVGIHRDITSQVEAEASRDYEQLLFQSLFEEIPDFIYFKDAESRFLRINRAMTQWLSLPSAASAIGKTDHDIFDQVHADEARRDELEIMRTGRPIVGCVEKEIWPDGRVTWARSTKLPLRDAKGVIIGTFGISRNVTEEKLAEQALLDSESLFRSVWTQSNDGMRLTDTQGQVLSVNDAYCHLFDTTREKIVGQSIDSVYKPSDDGATSDLTNYLQRFQNPNSTSLVELTKTLHSGRVLHFETSYSIVQKTGGESLYLTIFRDQTAKHKEAQAKHLLEQKMLETQRLESLGLIAGGVAHDFNNLLTTILGGVALVAEEMDPALPALATLRTVEDACLQAAKLCKQMLAYSGRGRFEMQHHDLNQLICETHNLLLLSISKNIELQLDLAPTVNAVSADHSQIRQVLMNLVSNASEAIGDGPGTIIVKTGTVLADPLYLSLTHPMSSRQPGTYVYFEVTDSGCGMDEETQARIFDPFFTTKFTGRGLGLAAVLGIIQGHHGALRVKSQVNNGTTFTLLLPSTSEPLTPTTPSNTASPTIQGKGLALVVDDEEGVRSLIARILEGYGFTVHQAFNGAEGLEVFIRHQNEIKLVVSDMVMPVMNGDKMFAEIRALKSNIPLLLVSGYDAQDISEKLNNELRVGFLSKPFRPVDLAAKLSVFKNQLSSCK